ncbi:MAG: hypothetical protein HQK76_19130 [Desulfobacterales bacterium]|nr:hypothetical protein [Desulfobacterales bacterium]
MNQKYNFKILILTIFYFCIPIVDYFYSKSLNVSIYSGLVGWIALSPIYIGILIVIKKNKKLIKNK